MADGSDLASGGLPRSPAAESQGVEVLAEPVADERLYVVVRTQCGGGEGDTRATASRSRQLRRT